MGGAGGLGGAAGLGGRGLGGTSAGGRDGGAADAGVTDAGRDASPACTLLVDGGTAACTTQIISANDNDIYCALKADGRMNCWATADEAFVFMAAYPWSGAVAKAPPRLAQLSMTNAILGGGDSPYLFCGVDRDGQGSCWNDTETKTMGQGLRAVILSNYGTCTLDAKGALSCTYGFVALPPAAQVWARILPSENVMAALDVTGAAYYPYVTFPSGTYVDIAANDARRVAAVRADGTAVAFHANLNPVMRLGSFTHVAVDYAGDACALDRAGAITCWPVDAPDGAPPLTPPPGSFVAIVGAERTFCAVRATGTTACFGQGTFAIPTGW
jgi:hypothetical protein